MTAQKRNLTSGSAADDDLSDHTTFVPSWEHYGSMLFLQESVEPAPQLCNLIDDKPEEETELEPDLTSTQNPSKTTNQPNQIDYSQTFNPLGHSFEMNSDQPPQPPPKKRKETQESENLVVARETNEALLRIARSREQKQGSNSLSDNGKFLLSFETALNEVSF